MKRLLITLTLGLMLLCLVKGSSHAVDRESVEQSLLRAVEQSLAAHLIHLRHGPQT